jgi:hypothetical protein
MTSHNRPDMEQQRYPLDLTHLPIDVTDHILKFRAFLIAVWPSFDQFMMKHDWNDDGNFIDEWLEANWEFLVERELLGNQGLLTAFESPYRCKTIRFMGEEPTYTISAKSDEIIFDLRRPNVIVPLEENLYFHGFRSMIKFGLYPPFEVVQLARKNSKETYWVPVDKVRFNLVKF